MRKEKILSRLKKLEFLETCFTPEEFRRALRHHGATGEWPADVSRGAVERARLMLRSETGAPPRGEYGHLLCESCLDAGQFTLASHPDNGSYNLCNRCAAAQTGGSSK